MKKEEEEGEEVEEKERENREGVGREEVCSAVADCWCLLATVLPNRSSDHTVVLLLIAGACWPQCWQTGRQITL